MIDLGALADGLLDLFGDVLIGDGIAPTEGGWSAGAPNVNTFAPYSTLLSEGAKVWNPSDIARSDPDGWVASWSLRSYGGSRRQLDWQANAARAIPGTALNLRFGETDTFKVAGLEWNALGSLVRVDTTDPPYWQAFDVFTLLCSRVRTPNP